MVVVNVVGNELARDRLTHIPAIPCLNLDSHSLASVVECVARLDCRYMIIVALLGELSLSALFVVVVVVVVVVSVFRE